MTGRFPFGRPSARRPPRVPSSGEAELFVLGVYPSALHVRWRRPDGKTIGALAVDDGPTVFWDGADARARIDAWRDAVGWRDSWGTIGMAGGNGSSGRVVVDDVLRPLGVSVEATYFTDCLPYYFVKSGAGSQGARIAEVYVPFAEVNGLPVAELPPRPTEKVLVRRTLDEESGELGDQLVGSGAARVVTLGQEAADVFAVLTGSENVLLKQDLGYGTWVAVHFQGRRFDWLPLTHPGNRNQAWKGRHQRWIAAQGALDMNELKITIASDADRAKHLVSVDPSERPETWVVEFRADDGTTDLLAGKKYGDFEGLYFRYPIDNLYAWCLPTASGTVHVTTPDGTTADQRSSGWR